MNNKHRKTLEAIFENPTRSDIAWKEVEKLFVALGAEVKEGAGSRVIFYIEGQSAIFHRPHPRKETDKGAVKSVQEFLKRTGVII